MKVNGKCHSIWRSASPENIGLFKAFIESIFRLGNRTSLEATSAHISDSKWGCLKQVALRSPWKRKIYMEELIPQRLALLQPPSGERESTHSAPASHLQTRETPLKFFLPALLLLCLPAKQREACNISSLGIVCSFATVPGETGNPRVDGGITEGYKHHFPPLIRLDQIQCW